jgi:hypothetical protein
VGPAGRRDRWRAADHGIRPAVRRVAVAGLVVAGVTLAAGWIAGRWDGVDGAGTAEAAASAPATVVLPAPEVVAPTSEGEWRTVVQEVYARRAEAFATASPELLADVHVSGSDLLAADTALARTLAEAGEVLRGFDPVVQEVTRAERVGERVQLDLVDSWPGYDVAPAARPDGVAVRTGAARPVAAVRMVLVRVGEQWLIESAERSG